MIPLPPAMPAMARASATIPVLKRFRASNASLDTALA
jgi:hypothetical protein